MECEICCLKYKNSVECNFCFQKACMNCIEKYIHNQSCMFCNRPWTYEFLQEKLSKTFFKNQYKKSLEKTLFEKEKAFLPATQEVIDKKLKIDKIMEEIGLLQDALKTLKQNETKQQNTKTVSCPNTKCNGFLDDKYECSLCNCNVCKKCLLIKENEEHKCKEEDLETMKELKKNCKPCPSCTMFIWKIDGCDQMWCISCKKAFSWNTGEIVTKNIHNPHYYEWFRRQGREVPREAPVNQCEGLPDYWSINNRQYTGSKEIDEQIIKLHRCLIHLQDYELREISDWKINLHHRINFLNRKIDKNKFMFLIQRTNKKHLFNKEKKSIYQTYFSVCCDLLREVIRVKNEEEQLNIYEQLQSIQKYSRENLKKLEERYNYRQMVLIPGTTKKDYP